MKISALVLILVLALTACGEPKGTDWVFRTNSDTMTVREAGELWSGLEPGERAVFTGKAEPVREFLLAISRRSMLDSELTETGLLSSPQVLRYEVAWQRSTRFLALADSLPARIVRGLGESEIAFFREHMGRTVWFTDMSSGVENGPHHLPELPRELTMALSAAAQGGLVTVEGAVFRLDSLEGTDSTLLAEALADTANIRRLALSRLSSAEAQRTISMAEELALSETTIDTTLVLAFAAAGGDIETGSFDPDQVILDCPFVDLTARDLFWEISYTSRSTPVSPGSTTWLLNYLRNLVRLSAGAALFCEEWPEEAEGIVTASHAFGRQTALDALYHERVSSRVTVTDSILQAEFQGMTEPLLYPEQRVLEIGSVREDVLPDLRQALQNEDHETVRTLLQPYSNWPGFNTGSLLSIPVTASQVPEAMGGIVFSADPADSVTWYGPMETSHGSMMVYRTALTLPRRPATFEEAREWLEMSVRSRLEETRTLEWMDELKMEHRLELNEELLPDLPADPALWTEL
ncbi:MAG: peptidylprolyl isomerase [Candidatus Fermentibacteraceae bacterium]